MVRGINDEHACTYQGVLHTKINKSIQGALPRRGKNLFSPKIN